MYSKKSSRGIQVVHVTSCSVWLTNQMWQSGVAIAGFQSTRHPVMPEFIVSVCVVGTSQSLNRWPQEKWAFRKVEEESVGTQHVFTLPFSSSPKTSSVFHVFTFLAMPSHFCPPGLRLSVGASRHQTHGCPLKQDNPRPYSALPLN